MEFRKINNYTIDCIITAKDLEESGLKPADFFENKVETLLFIRSVLQRAATEESIGLSAALTRMRVTVMPDQTVLLTLSSDQEPTTQNSYLYHFESMYALTCCARQLPKISGQAEASLYADESGEGYYLIVGRGGISGTKYERIILAISEFGTLITSHPGLITRIKEHNPCLMEANAILLLSRL